MRSSLTDRGVLIVGGGIGGLALALGLAQKGIASTILEQAPELGEIGAGIQIGPNAFHCFDQLGIGDAARSMAVYVDKLRLMDAVSSDEILQIDLGEAFRERFSNNPYAVAHRGALHGLLLSACDASDRVKLRVNCEVVRYEQDDSSATAFLSSGEAISGWALVGADGLWSNIRSQLVGDGPPRVTGHSTYRSVIPVDQMPEELRWNAMTLWAGPRCHLVHYPLSDWNQFNLVVTYHNEAPEPVAGKSVATDEVLRGFERIHPLARKIIEYGTDWKLWVLCDREPVENWSDGRVTLLGDAAHPTLQYLAQGACMALEDAVILSQLLDLNRDDIAQAFADYEANRLARTACVTLTARAMGEHVFHPDGAHALVRNDILRSWSQEECYHRLEWLYGWTCTSEPASQQ